VLKIAAASKGVIVREHFHRLQLSYPRPCLAAVFPTSLIIGNLAPGSKPRSSMEAVHRRTSQVEEILVNGERDMCKSFIPALGFAFALTLVTSAQAAPLMPLAPLHQPDSIVTTVRAGCGLGYQRRAGVCVRNTTVRRVRRTVRRARRCVRWHGAACLQWRYY